MQNKDLPSSINKYIEKFQQQKDLLQGNIINLCKIIKEANENLSKEDFKIWINDKRINIKETQVKKYIAIAKKDPLSQSTALLSKEGIEKVYLMTLIEDDEIRENCSQKIIDIPFTVKQTRAIVKQIIEEKVDLEAAIEGVKALTSSPSSLKKQYENLQKFNNDLEKQVNVLKKENIQHKSTIAELKQKLKAVELKLIINLETNKCVPNSSNKELQSITSETLVIKQEEVNSLNIENAEKLELEERSNKNNRTFLIDGIWEPVPLAVDFDKHDFKRIENMTINYRDNRRNSPDLYK